MTPYYRDNNCDIYHGDALQTLKTLPDACVQCVVTSPPYWGLRDYGANGQLGLEDTPEEFVAKMVEIFREVRRCLRPDGVMFLNLGDTYVTTKKGSGGHSEKQDSNEGSHFYNCIKSEIPPGLKPKDLCGIPWRVAFAMQADGWWLRQDIIWSKPSPMPESVSDRCTKAHEYIFLMTKQPRYFYDAEAIKEKAVAVRDMGLLRGKSFYDQKNVSWHSKSIKDRQDAGIDPRFAGSGYRNKRSVWTVASQGYPDAHFATYPEKLIQPCVLAGTSAAGCCAECGTPRERVVEITGGPPNNRFKDGLAIGGKTAHTQGTVAGAALSRLYREYGYPIKKNLGWQPTCKCAAETVPCTVLDPFHGAGTTAVVAKSYNRRYIGIDIKAEYIDMSLKRIRQEVLPLGG